MNVITGLPRSGSTLLCNLLNQNPAFYASSTSTLPQILAGAVQAWSATPEIMGALVRDHGAASEKIARTARAICAAWHDKGERAVFDKSRGWISHLPLLWAAYPDAKVVVTLRDPRSVFASVERIHRRTALLDDTPSSPERPLHVAKSIMGRADVMFGPNGLIGAPLLGIQDLVQRRLDDQVFWLRLEELSASPVNTLTELYRYLDVPSFNHDVEAVQDTAEDVDALYLHKFPHHDATGAVEPATPEDWREVMSDEVSDAIKAKLGWFYARFYPPKADPPTRVQKDRNGGGRTVARGVLSGKR